MDILQVNNITKSFGTVKVLEGISMNLQQGAFGCLLGSSGSGKSTLLRIVAGLEVQDSGTVHLGDQLVSGDKIFVKPEKRNVGMIFQDYALFPHLTVEQNILFGARKGQRNSPGLDQLVEVLGLRELLKRYPHQVSGGQQQRIAIARSLMVNPQLLLMDEPFSNLDEWMKEEVRDELKIILRDLGATVLFVTHHAQDALSFADQILIMDEGKILQQGNAADIIDRPVNAKVAGIFGKVNRFDARDLKKLFDLDLPAGHYFIKPDHFVRDNSANEFRVRECVYHGSYYDVNVTAGDKHVHLHLPEAVEPGQYIRLSPIGKRIFHEPD
jgi:iron(III) transport system ATP-binding protein